MITIGFSTREHNQNYIDYIQKTCMFKEVEIIEKVNKGTQSLSEVYNEIINESSNDVVVLIHDDLEFDTKNWGDKLLKGFQKNPEFGIVGLAGTKFLPSNAKWWTVSSTMYGIVNHKQNGKKWTSIYSADLGQKFEDVVITDGLFIALDKTKIKHKFDETIPGFHFYDLGFTLKNYLDGVKVGVTTMVRVTHLSIGETNTQWEKNRQDFETKYQNQLPINILPKDQNETFIFCHEQDLILEFEQNNKFKSLYKYTYVFLGKRPVDKLSELQNVIIARNLDHNLEDYPLFTSFTGWYALWKNNLISTKYVNLFEYDVVLDPYIDQRHCKFYEQNVELIGYVPFPVAHYQFITNQEWVEHILPAIKEVYRHDLYQYFSKLLQNNPQAVWSSTSNTTFRFDVFEEYMKWFEPLIPYLKDTKTCGHAHERSITFFSHMRKKKQLITNGILQHLQLDSHKTQGHSVNMDDSLKKLMSH
jgi:hypothetical protein